MPELPDLEVFAKNLSKCLKGRPVSEVKVAVAKAADRSAAAIKKLLVGKKLLRVERHGKQLRFCFEDSIAFFLHQMLHGKLFLTDKKEEVKFPLLALIFDDGQKLTLSDFQKKANVHFDAPDSTAPDALSSAVNLTFLRQLVQDRSTPIKKLLVDQKKIRGIGSAYADEILWDSGISPFSESCAIPDEGLRALSRSIKKVLRNGIKQIDRLHPGILQGEVREHMNVHNAERTESVDGYPILKKKDGGRTTYYTERQKLYTK